MKVRSKHWITATLAFSVLLPGLGLAALDSDTDGVPDDQDECPQTPAKTPVDKRGCTLKVEPVPEAAAAAADAVTCLTPPAGAMVDSYGCAVDEDADGVPDGIDQCPHTAKGVAVDVAGCAPQLAKEAPAAKKVQPAKKGTVKKITEPLPAIPDVAPVESGTDRPAPQTAAIPVTEPASAPVAVPPPPPPALVEAPKPELPQPEAAAMLNKPAPAAEAPAVSESKMIPVQPAQAPPAPVAEVQSAPAATMPPTVAVTTPVPTSAPAAAAAAADAELPRYLAVHFTANSAELSAESLRKLDLVARRFLEALSAKPNLKLDLQARANATNDGRIPEDVARNRLDIVRVYLMAQGIAKDRLMLSTQVDQARSVEAQRDARRVEIKLNE